VPTREHLGEERHRDGRFSFRARPVAVWSLAFSFACLATLAVVVGTGDEDPLASIALALAIFAFALQIVFFVVQLRVASDQDRRSADLYRETSAVLTKIDARSVATVEVIRDQFGFVLRHALGAPLDGSVSAGAGETDDAGLDEDPDSADEQDLPITLTWGGRGSSEADFSPDGRTIAYTGVAVQRREWADAALHDARRRQRQAQAHG
jgi:hypothetical protein